MKTGQELRDNGIAVAIQHANQVEEKWSEIAYNFFLSFIRNNSEFQIEDVRTAAINSVPEPPSKRAWGGIAVKASKAGLIRRMGFRNVKNPKAHCTPATVWQVT